MGVSLGIVVIKALDVYNVFYCTNDKYLGKQDWEEIASRPKYPDLIQQIMEDRFRHARGPVQSSSPLHI